MRGCRFVCAAVATILLAVPVAWAQSTWPLPPDPTGEWLVEKGLAVIRIVNCSGRFWGVVAWEARPGIDRHNPDRSQQNRPTLGMPILLGMVQTKANRWEGEIYNSQDGNTYSATISLKDPNTLRVQGCFLAILCGGQNWSRVQPPPISPPPPSNSRPPNSQPPNTVVPAPDIMSQPDTDVCLGLIGPPRLPH